jgi:hypothetical protein
MQLYEREMENDGVKNLATLLSERIHMMTRNLAHRESFIQLLKGI